MEFWFTELHTPNVKFSVKVDKHLYTAENDLGRVDIFESPEFGRFLAVDGYIIFTQRDEFIYDEMLSHIPMAVKTAFSANANRVLLRRILNTFSFIKIPFSGKGRKRADYQKYPFCS